MSSKLNFEIEANKALALENESLKGTCMDFEAEINQK